MDLHHTGIFVSGMLAVAQITVLPVLVTGSVDGSLDRAGQRLAQGMCCRWGFSLGKHVFGTSDICEILK